ncbi:MAG TPA: hypothetical protein VGW77_03780 [Candidatus Binatia bacterium]|jgi:hypothetical protein|nr:hypothetical protein [Candidatus Binatia bacterium]
MPKNIVRVELSSGDYPLHCPFCGCCVLRVSEEPGKQIEPGEQVCPHTLFVASDDGFHFCSTRFTAAMGLSDINDADIDNFDKFTNKVSLYGAVKFAFYDDDPGGGLGMYVGFAPDFEADEESELDEAEVEAKSPFHEIENSIDNDAYRLGLKSLFERIAGPKDQFDNDWIDRITEQIREIWAARQDLEDGGRISVHEFQGMFFGYFEVWGSNLIKNVENGALYGPFDDFASAAKFTRVLLPNPKTQDIYVSPKYKDKT